MTKYFYLYSGSSKSNSDAANADMMAAWMAYFGKLGPALVDFGAPFMPLSALIGNAKTCGSTGYSIIQAGSLEEAVALTQGHPHLAAGGGIEVFEYAPI